MSVAPPQPKLCPTTLLQSWWLWVAWGFSSSLLTLYQNSQRSKDIQSSLTPFTALQGNMISCTSHRHKYMCKNMLGQHVLRYDVSYICCDITHSVCSFFFSLSMVHSLKPSLKLIAAPEATLIVELGKWVSTVQSATDTVKPCLLHILFNEL